MQRPNIKLSMMSKLLFPVRGETRIKSGYKYGLIYPRKLI
jgi:hypothetical protein